MRIAVARTRAERMRGLRGRPRLLPGEALLIPNCRAVHTFGMRFPITVAYLDRDCRVLEVVRMRPNRLGRPRWRAHHVLETGADDPLATGDLVLQARDTGPAP